MSDMKFEIYRAVETFYGENGWTPEPGAFGAAIEFFERVEQGRPVELKLYGVAGGGKTVFLRCLAHVGIQCVAYSLGRYGRYVHLVRDERTGGEELGRLPARVAAAKLSDFVFRFAGGGNGRQRPDNALLFRTGQTIVGAAREQLGSPFLAFALLAELTRWRSLCFTSYGDFTDRYVAEVADLRGFGKEKKRIADVLIETHNTLRRGADDDENGFLARYAQGDIVPGQNAPYVVLCDDTEDMTPLEIGVLRRLRQDSYVARTLDPHQNRLWTKTQDEEFNTEHRIVGEFFTSHRLSQSVGRHLNFYNEPMSVAKNNIEGAIYKCDWRAMIEKCRPGDLIVVRTLDELIRVYFELTALNRSVAAMGRRFEMWMERLAACLRAAHPQAPLHEAVHRLREELDAPQWATLRERELTVWKGLFDGLSRLMRQLGRDDEESLCMFWRGWGYGVGSRLHLNAVNVALDRDCKHFEADCVWYVNQHQIPHVGKPWDDYLARIHYLVASRARGRLVLVTD